MAIQVWDDERGKEAVRDEIAGFGGDLDMNSIGFILGE